MVAYTKPQQRKKEESEKLRGERDQIKRYGNIYINNDAAVWCDLWTNYNTLLSLH